MQSVLFLLLQKCCVEGKAESGWYAGGHAFAWLWKGWSQKLAILRALDLMADAA